MIRIGTTILPGLLMLALGAAPLGAAEGGTDLSLRVATKVGYNSNPLRVMNDGANGVYADLGADVVLSRKITAPVKWFLDADANTKRYDSDTSGADTADLEMRTGLIVSPRGAGRRFAVSVGGTYSAYRGTLTSRADGTLYEVSSSADPAVLVDIPDRFDHQSVGGFVNARLRVSPRVRLSLDSKWSRFRYTEDYSELTDLDSLDRTRLSIEPGITVKASPTVSFGLVLSLRETDYDELAALDSSGQDVDGADRRYRQVSYRLFARIRPLSGWHTRVGFRGFDRQDQFAGYYDSTSFGAFLTVQRDFGPRGSVQLYGSHSDVGYEMATIPGETDGELRGTKYRRIVGRYSRPAARGLEWFGEAGMQRTNSEDLLFTYNQNFFAFGIVYER